MDNTYRRVCLLGCRVGERRDPLPLLTGAAGQLGLTGVRSRGVGSGRTDDERAVRYYKPNPPPVKFKAERRFAKRCIGSREWFFGFNRYA